MLELVRAPDLPQISASAIPDISAMIRALMMFSRVTHSPGCLWGQSCHSFCFAHSWARVQVIEGLPLKEFLDSRRMFGIFIVSSDLPATVSRRMAVHSNGQS